MKSSLRFLLSFLFPGVGDIHAGHFRLGKVVIAAYFALTLAIAFSGVLTTLRGAWAACSLVLVTRLACGIISARHKPTHLHQKFRLAKLLGWIAISVVTQLPPSLAGYRSYRIPSPSMAPTLAVGCRIMSRSTSPQDLGPGDIIVFAHNGNSVVARIVANPGESVRVVEDKVITTVGGEVWKKGEIKEPPPSSEFQQGPYQLYNVFSPSKKKFTTQLDLSRSPREDFYLETVPEKHFFVMSDNRNGAMDGRDWGPIPWSSIQSKVLYTWFCI